MFLKVDIGQVEKLYSESPSERYNALVGTFNTVYGSKPEFICRAPGRVNIIGEHIDYEGYGVLPAAIEKDCLIAVRPIQADYIEVNHVNSATYPPCKLPKNPQTVSTQVAHAYAKYFAAGYRAGILDLVEGEVAGLQILIEGNIPVASGVSSSSALCVCSALVSHTANEGRIKPIPKEEFVQRCISFEREVGTASGGMDQSISILGELHSCLNIEFNPVRGRKVTIPEGCKFVVMNSLVESAKLQTAVFRYNKRVCQCRLAMYILSKVLGVTEEVYLGWKTLKELQDWLHLSLEQMAMLVSKYLPAQAYTQAKIQQMLSQSLQVLLKDIPLYEEVLKANKQFALYEAAFHVFNQAKRVQQFVSICESKLGDEVKRQVLGALMNESQTSCRELYKCSCEELDAIVSLALKNGAYGSRLTGAGWGGCTVSLVHESKVEQFIHRMAEYYQSTPELGEKIEKVGIKNALFATQPCQGASVITL